MIQMMSLLPKINAASLNACNAYSNQEMSLKIFILLMLLNEDAKLILIANIYNTKIAN
jgi:hypothetical protein